MTMRDDLAPAGEADAPSDGSGCLQLRAARADNGFHISLNELGHTGERPLLWSVDEKMRLVRRHITGRVSIRSREAVCLSLASGRELQLIPEQSVLKVDGWMPVGQLSVGNRIGVVSPVVRTVPAKANG